jgi:hypothetical protein
MVGCTVPSLAGTGSFGVDEEEPVMRKRLLRPVLALAGAATCVLASGVGVLPASAASASVADCDRTSYIATYRTVWSGASIVREGRDLRLWNHIGDLYSYAAIYYGYQVGDAVWIDRSHYYITPGEFAGRYPSTADVQRYGGGWKQCGPFYQKGSHLVKATTPVGTGKQGYATRACFRPKNGSVSHCGSWYIDRP